MKPIMILLLLLSPLSALGDVAEKPKVRMKSPVPVDRKKAAETFRKRVEFLRKASLERKKLTEETRIKLKRAQTENEIAQNAGNTATGAGAGLAGMIALMLGLKTKRDAMKERERRILEIVDTAIAYANQMSKKQVKADGEPMTSETKMKSALEHVESVKTAKALKVSGEIDWEKRIEARLAK